MANCAKVVLLGRITTEPQDKTWQGTKVASFSMAVNTTKKEGDKYISDFYNVSIWGKPAEYILPRIRKGIMVQVTGDLALQKYTGKDGTEKQALSVRATEIVPLDFTKKDTAKKAEEDNDDPPPF